MNDRTSNAAVYGWKKTRNVPFEPQDGPKIHHGYENGMPSHGPYVNAVNEVLASEILSGYRGNATQAFWGGKKVQQLESEVQHMFDAKHAIACNSATSALYMACVAAGIGPGDEVIVTPWSMSCSATVPLLLGAIPVFADIDDKTFMLNPIDVAEKITEATKAIIVVDLFGMPFPKEISSIAEEHGLVVIEDSAQAIGGYRDGKYAGLLGDIGVYSFTQGKHLTAGEGGMAVTNSDDYAMKLALTRNHSEAVVSDAYASEDISKMMQFDSCLGIVGMNLRMTEMQAAIISIELKQLKYRIGERKKNAEKIISAFSKYCSVSTLADIDCGSNGNIDHALYCLPIKFNDDVDTGVIASSIRSELVGDRVRIDRGVPVSNGYITPLYKMPLFSAKSHWAFKLAENAGLGQKYDELDLPVAEKFSKSGLIITLLHALNLNGADMDDITTAISKAMTSYMKEQ